MNSNTYHSCAVRECKNTSIKTPGKLWIIVPSIDIEMRKIWLNLARRDPNLLSRKSPLYFCEDHFDLENDMENYMQYKIMGSVRTVRMKPNCVPSKFDCQVNPQPKSSKPRKTYVKRQRMSNIQEIDNQGLRNRNVVRKADKGVQACPVTDHKATQINVKNHEPKQSSTGRKEIKVFCPKCNSEVSHTAEGIQEDQTKALIAKVFHYFEEELELLKKMRAKQKLSHLSKFHYRTAQATGVSETAVIEILQEEARRKAAKRCEKPARNVDIQQKVAKNAEVYQEVPQNADIYQEPPKKRRRSRKNPSLAERSNEDTNDSAKYVRQPNVLHEIKVELETEELSVKEEPVEYHDEEPEISIEPSNVKGFNSVQTQIDPISTEVKVEPLDDEMNERRIEEESSIAEAPSYYQQSEQLYVTQATPEKVDINIEINYDPSTSNSSHTIPVRSSLMEVGQVKVVKIEIEEEGFS